MSTEQQPRWGIVEVMGHRKLAGRIEKATQYGVVGIQVEVPAEGGGFHPPQFYPGTSLFGVTQVPESTAREQAKDHYVRAALRDLGLVREQPPALGAHDRPDDGDDYDFDPALDDDDSEGDMDEEDDGECNTCHGPCDEETGECMDEGCGGVDEAMAGTQEGA